VTSPSEPLRFELDRLLVYDVASFVAEIQRVAALVTEPALTRAAFDRIARVDSSTIVKRLGGWREALDLAGLGERYSGRTVSETMRNQRARMLTDEELVAELRRVADILGTRTLTREAFRRHSDGVNDAAVARRFGSWANGLRRADLELSPLGRRWTDEDYFENLLEVWTHYGRPPRYAEMNLPPSRITAGGYENKFGTWGRAKVVFVKRVNADLGTTASVATDKPKQLRPPEPRTRSTPEDRRTIPLGIRYRILSRDHFRCTVCGRSPATDVSVTLHVDHVTPLARGGKTVEENLRTLCADCNLGKAARLHTT
jgi:hypothetical protein